MIQSWQMHSPLRIIGCGLAAVLLSGAVASAQTDEDGASEPALQAVEDAGFRIVVTGYTEDMDGDEFRKAVVDALPDRLLDPSQNFTQDDAFDHNARYKLVMVFHAEGAEPTQPLCTIGDPGAVEVEPPDYTDLLSATHVQAAFCQNGESLTTTSDRLSGRTDPRSASFRFLVRDVAQQLFAAGFDQVPRVSPQGTTIPAVQ